MSRPDATLLVVEQTMTRLGELRRMMTQGAAGAEERFEEVERTANLRRAARRDPRIAGLARQCGLADVAAACTG